ncbi:hypothetical protein O3G_MSEX008196 [Manduca sexta]|uniref:Uncharacterized protein n=1 Tax=Manduca sexta TaxID=7130 RepID=A0A922CPV9_MANSE|nr:hypothetical protein O3G_MSEX008196 [Manduca sexta]
MSFKPEHNSDYILLLASSNRHCGGTYPGGLSHMRYLPLVNINANDLVIFNKRTAFRLILMQTIECPLKLMPRVFISVHLTVGFHITKHQRRTIDNVDSPGCSGGLWGRRTGQGVPRRTFFYVLTDETVKTGDRFFFTLPGASRLFLFAFAWGLALFRAAAAWFSRLKVHNLRGMVYHIAGFAWHVVCCYNMLKSNLFFHVEVLVAVSTGEMDCLGSRR